MPQLNLTDDELHVLDDAMDAYAANGPERYRVSYHRGDDDKHIVSLHRKVAEAMKATEPEETFWVSGTVCPSKMPLKPLRS